MLGSLDQLILWGSISLGVLTILTAFWALNRLWGSATPLKQIFCPEDRSTCHCRSCRAERNEP